MNFSCVSIAAVLALSGLCGEVPPEVAPGGETFRVFVLDAGDESMTVLSSREWKSGGSARP